MSTLTPTITEAAGIDVFTDPVTYLAALGIVAEVVGESAALPSAA